MKKTKLITLDCETTGVSTKTARIVELCIYDVKEDKFKTYLINPEQSIPQGAVDVHHITDEMVKDKPTFKTLSKELYSILKNTTIIGYNSKKFDVPLVQEEFKRCGINWEPKAQIDLYAVWTQMEKTKKLGDAYKRFCNKTIEGAHRAEVDVKATFEIFQTQEILWGTDQLIKLTEQSKELVDKPITNIFSFGKYKSKSIKEVKELDMNYLNWLLKQDFVNSGLKILIEKEINGDQY